MTYPVIGIIGQHCIDVRTVISMGAGKTTFAKFFVEAAKEFEAKYEIHAFGNAIKAEIARFAGVSIKFLEANKPMFRRMMEGYATDFARAHYGNNVWVDKLDITLKRRSMDLFNPVTFIIDDVRFGEEVEYIRDKCQGILIAVKRVSINDLFKYGSLELESPPLSADFTITNSGSLEQFRETVKKFTSKLLSAYEAGKFDKSTFERSFMAGSTESDCQSA